jgi:hypothetical protein
MFVPPDFRRTRHQHTTVRLPSHRFCLLKDEFEPTAAAGRGNVRSGPLSRHGSDGFSLEPLRAVKWHAIIR